MCYSQSPRHPLGSLLALAAIFAALLCLFGCRGTDSTVRVGGVYALTEKAASFGKEVKTGVDLAVEEVNRTGGIKGRRLEVVSEDTRSDAKIAVSAFEKLIAIDKIPAAVGFISSAEALACVPVAQRTRVVMITPIAGTPKLRGAGDFVFRTVESGLEQSQMIAEFIYRRLATQKAAILCENAANAVGYRDAFIERFTKLGGVIEGNLTYEDGQTDFRLVLTRLKSMSPKAVYLPGVGKVLGRVLKQAHELQVHTRYFSSAGIEDPALFQIAGDAANGIIYGAPVFSLGSEEPATKSFVKSYGERFHKDPSVYSANAYDALMIIATALRDGGNTGDAIRDSLSGLRDYRGASGVLTFDKYGEVSKPVILKQTINQQFVVLE
jgi:branched-chain amino acid transport system substrate-binding protein